MGDPVHVSHEHTGALILLRHDQVHIKATTGTKVVIRASLDFSQIKVKRTKIYLANHTTIITNPLGHYLTQEHSLSNPSMLSN